MHHKRAEYSQYSMNVNGNVLMLISSSDVKSINTVSIKLTGTPIWDDFSMFWLIFRLKMPRRNWKICDIHGHWCFSRSCFDYNILIQLNLFHLNKIVTLTVSMHLMLAFIASEISLLNVFCSLVFEIVAFNWDAAMQCDQVFKLLCT